MVEVEAKAFGLNFREVMVALGELDEPLKGHESAGVITALGPGTEESGLKIGDRVCSLVRGRLASRGRTWWTSVAKLPDDMPIAWEHAAAFPAAYVTAYGSLVQLANLKRGESVLVHAASGGTGQAAVNLAQYFGAEVYATCSTRAKRDLLVHNFGLDPDHIFSSRDASFAPAIMEATGGKGVDVVLNSLSGPLLKATWDCMARFGRLVDITKIDMEANRGLDTAPFGRCATYTSFDLLQLTEYRGSLTREALVESIRIIRERAVPPIHPITPFSITDMATAMRQMQGGAHTGKLVLVPNPGDKVNVSVSRLAQEVTACSSSPHFNRFLTGHHTPTTSFSRQGRRHVPDLGRSGRHRPGGGRLDRPQRRQERRARLPERQLPPGGGQAHRGGKGRRLPAPDPRLRRLGRGQPPAAAGPGR